MPLSRQVREHHRDLAALGGVHQARLGSCCNSRCRCARLDVFEVANRPQQLAAMSQRDAELLQILIRQVGEDTEVDPVLIEALCILSKTELVVAVSLNPHRGPAQRVSPQPERVPDPPLRLRSDVSRALFHFDLRRNERGEDPLVGKVILLRHSS